MESGLRQLVKSRARSRCEYCQLLAEDEPDAPFHVEHIIARQHRGETTSENLALACAHCNLHKGPNLAGRDPVTGETVRLFHPRTDHWEDHFRRVAERIEGVTGIGRTTAELLQFNSAINLLQRRSILERRGHIASESKPGR